MIPLCIPDVGQAEAELLRSCIESGFVSSVGPFVEQFELAFANAVGAPFAVACTSGTAAIHLALRAVGVTAGDQVLVSDCTFIASANPIVHQGATPVFIDSEETSWNLDPQRVRDALAECAANGRPAKAVVAVHVYGQPADLGPIADACAEHGAVLIEDAAEALGAAWTRDYPHPMCRGKQVGTVGRIGCFSFNGNKVITTGGGGMCVTPDAVLAKRLKHLSTQAKLPGTGFVHDAVGYNYRLPNVNAALGLAQLRRLPAFLARKHAHAAAYRAFAARRGLTYHPQLAGTLASDWMPMLLVRDRDRVVAHLEARGIQARPCWRALAQQPAYHGARRHGGAVADRLAAEGLNLPCSVTLADADRDRVIATLEALL